MRGNSLPHLNGLLLPKKQQGIFYMYFPIDMTVHTTAFDIPVVEHWLERKKAQLDKSTEEDRSYDLSTSGERSTDWAKSRPIQTNNYITPTLIPNN